MQFKIKRTSGYRHDGKAPCVQAVQIYKDGSEWEVTIDTLEQLLALVKSVDDDIILKKDGTLEIYDDYRE